MISNWLRVTMLNIGISVCVLGSIFFLLLSGSQRLRSTLLSTDTTLDGFLGNPSPLGIACAYTLETGVLDVFS